VHCSVYIVAANTSATQALSRLLKGGKSQTPWLPLYPIYLLKTTDTWITSDYCRFTWNMVYEYPVIISRTDGRESGLNIEHN